MTFTTITVKGRTPEEVLRLAKEAAAKLDPYTSPFIAERAPQVSESGEPLYICEVGHWGLD